MQSGWRFTRLIPWIVAVLFSLEVVFNTVLLVNNSPSMPLGLYVRLPVMPENGDMVFFPNPRRDLLDTPLLLKDVVLTDGETMEVQGRHPRSFDSRIYGEVTTRGAMKAIPLWIWETGDKT